MPRGAFRINTLSIPDGTFGGGTPPPPAESYWITRLGGSGNDGGYGIDVDSSGNVYVTGYITGSGLDLYLGKFDKNGSPLWQRSLGSAGTDTVQGQCRVASSGNIYVAGYTASTGQTAGSNDFLVAKYNNSGTIQWQRRLGGTSSDLAYAGLGIDSSENVYVVGGNQSQTLGAIDITVAKWNTSGTIQFQKSYGGTGTDVGYGVYVSSDGTTYIAGESTSATLNGGGSVDCYVSKLNSSGTASWQIGDGLSTLNDDRFRAVTVDSAGNVIACGFITVTGQLYAMFVVKYNSSGVRQWYNIINASTSNEQAFGIDVDSSDNIYVVGNGTADVRGIILKLNSSGALQWSRYLGSTSTGNDALRGIKISGSNMYIIGDAGGDTGTVGGTDVFFCKLPTDGTKTGTYTLNSSSWTYADAGLTGSQSGYTLSQYTRSFTETTRTLTEAATTLGGGGYSPSGRHITTL